MKEPKRPRPKRVNPASPEILRALRRLVNLGLDRARQFHYPSKDMAELDLASVWLALQERAAGIEQPILGKVGRLAIDVFRAAAVERENRERDLRDRAWGDDDG